ncbi:unnamed protein product [Ascophyllum nodosum]
MEDLIPVVNKLQDVFSAIGQSPIDLPQIVVIGSQSSGKSSVLENVVGRDFLPRGTGIVTRRPLVLQLYNTAGPAGKRAAANSSSSSSSSSANAPPIPPPRRDLGQGQVTAGARRRDAGGHLGDRAAAFGGLPNGVSGTNPSVFGSPPRTPPRGGGVVGGLSPPGSPKPPPPEREWGEFLHLPGQKFQNFAEIREEIIRETERLTGSNKGISPKSINLRIYSPYVLNLTMVDLPGITKVATGDQPANIEEHIRSMCMQYIKNPNAIILSVTPANTDLANSDALKMARDVDPKGDRTVGVLTKIDLMDPGTDAADMLDNRVVPLKRGYVGVINRGQKGIDDGVSIRQARGLGAFFLFSLRLSPRALQKEAAFFRDHPAYRGLDKRVGTANLSKTLNQILMHHIRDCLPEIKSRLNVMTQSVTQQLVELGEPPDGGSASALGATLLTLLSKFASSYQSAVDGRGSSPDGIEMNELYGGARISYIFHEIFSHSLATIDPFESLSDQDIRTAIYNANGTRPSLFVPEMSFDLLVRKQIARLEQPGLQCADLVFDEMQRIAAQCEGAELGRFPCLRDRIVEVNHKLLRKCMNPTQTMIANLIKLELAYINTSHPDFIGGSRAIAEVMDRNRMANGGAGVAGAGDNPAGLRSPPPRNAASMSMGQGSTSSLSPPPRVLRGGVHHSARATAAGTGDAGNPFPREDSRPHSQPQAGGGLMSFIFGGGGNQERQGRQSPQMVKLPQPPETMRQTDDPTDRERCEMEIIKSLMRSYFDIARKNFQDLVPKAIMHFLVNNVVNMLQNELVSTLYKEGLTGELMRETDDVAERRRISKDMLVLLEKASSIVNEVRDFNPFLT